MRTPSISLLLLAGVVAALPAARAAHSQGSDCPCPCQPAETDTGGDPGRASMSYFHEQLSPYGRWVVRNGYGEVWVPSVATGWRPYTTGHWAYTDQGWAWVADESWGWAPFHYGRWFYEAGFGWGWVPGTVWAPAWVAWRNGGGYVGWAALPPAVGFSVGIGLSFGVSLDAVIAPSYYSFVGEGAILTPRLSTVIVAPERNTTIIQNTTNITNYSVVNNRVVNNGVNVQRIEQVTGRPVPRVSAASQAGFYQPSVVTRAARINKSESFVNRPARAGGSLITSQSARTTATTGLGTTGTHTTGFGTTGTLRSTRTTGTTGSRTTGFGATGTSQSTRSTGSGSRTTGTHTTGFGATGTAESARSRRTHRTTGSSTGLESTSTGLGTTGTSQSTRSRRTHRATGSSTGLESTGTTGTTGSPRSHARSAGRNATGGSTTQTTGGGSGTGRGTSHSQSAAPGATSHTTGTGGSGQRTHGTPAPQGQKGKEHKSTGTG
jgi:hypothetical protein